MTTSLYFGQPRMREVASLAGVSVITVSRVLRSPEIVTEETRARVTSAIRDLGYVTNDVASSLSLRRSSTAAAVIPNIRNPLHAAMIEGLSEVLHEASIQVIVAMVGQSQVREEEVITACLKQRPCAFVLYNTRHSATTREQLQRAQIPVVEVGDLVRRPIETVVSYSNREVGKALTRQLAQQGCREIAMALQPMSDNGRKRYRGHLAALRELGLPMLPQRRLACERGYNHGAELVGRIMETDPAVDAVLFSSVASAVGAWFECERRGWSRIRIASADDPEAIGWRGQKLIVARLPRFEAGQQAGRIIISRLRGEAPARTRIDLGFEVKNLWGEDTATVTANASMAA